MGYVFLGNSFVEALQGIFQTIFEKVFAPILTDVLQIFINYAINAIWILFSEWFLRLFVLLCSLVDFLESIFNIFAGLSPVEVSGQQTYLLDALLQTKQVTQAFAIITIMAVAICFIFTIFKTAKSISDMALEDRNPVSKVLASGMKAAVSFMLIPFLCIFLLQVSSVVTGQVVGAFDTAQGGHTSIGSIMFLTAGLEADKATTKEKSITTGTIEMAADRPAPSFTDDVRRPYLEGTHDYRDIDQVKRDFHVMNFDFLLGFTCVVLILFVLAGAVVVFIRRLFEILLLYIVSPFFVSTIPLDDGAVFAKWRDLFVAKFFSGFGTIFSMRYYLLLVPSIAGNSLCLYDKNLPGGIMIDHVLKLFLIIGGAYAVYKSQHLLMQILNPEAAMAEQQAGMLMTGMIMGAASTAASAGMAVASGGTTAALGGLSSVGSMASGVGKSVGGSVMSGASEENQAYRG